jgi:hypothetical protein
MRTTRDRLFMVMKRTHGECGDYSETVDALIEEFEITPKPAIDDEALGMLITETYTQGTRAERGNKLRHLLAGRELEIVRIDDDR